MELLTFNYLHYKGAWIGLFRTLNALQSRIILPLILCQSVTVVVLCWHQVEGSFFCSLYLLQLVQYRMDILG